MESEGSDSDDGGDGAKAFSWKPTVRRYERVVFSETVRDANKGPNGPVAWVSWSRDVEKCPPF